VLDFVVLLDATAGVTPATRPLPVKGSAVRADFDASPGGRPGVDLGTDSAVDEGAGDATVAAADTC